MTIPNRRARSARRTASLLAVTSIMGCAVGPDYKEPAAPRSHYVRGGVPGEIAGDGSKRNPAQRLVLGMDLPGEWWKLFHNQRLDDLIARALEANPDLVAAQAALRQARENVYAQEGSFFPNIDGGFSPSRNKTATAAVTPFAATGNPYYSLYTAQLTVTYNPDVFGLNRRQVESLVALAEVQRYQLEATYLTLTSNLVTAVITEASINAQIKATEEIIRIQHRSLDILKKQLALGQVARIDELAQEAATTQIETTLPPLRHQLAQQQDLIAALTGRLPDGAEPETFDLDSLQLPQDLPVSLPSSLVEQRPDVKQAEQNLHSASALIGVAIANRLPVLNLTAQGGSESLLASSLFGPGNGFWTLAADLTQPIFQGGILLHRQRAARAAFDQAAAQYRSTVISAFQNVADSLRALQVDADTVRVSTVAAREAAATVGITHNQLQLGQIAYLSLLGAQQLDRQAQLTMVQARATRLADTAALFQALGGGWWNRKDVDVKDIHGNDVVRLIGLKN